MDKINTTNLGQKPSIKDYRTFSADVSATSKVIFQTMLDINAIGGIMMQGHQPACVCFSVVEAMKVYFLELTGKVIDFEPAFLYALYISKYKQPVGSGCDMLSVLKLAQQYGCATKSTMNRDANLSLEEYSAPITSNATISDAAQYKIPGFAQIGTDIQSLRNAILKYKIVMTCRQIGSEWWTDQNGNNSWKSNDINPLRAPVSIESGHATCDIGFIQGDDVNIILNHWSDAWANHGTVAYKGTELAPFIREAFVISVVPQAHLSLVGSLPPEKEFSHNFQMTLTPGMQGSEIVALQIALMILGYLTVSPSTILGYFGPNTTAAVNALQTANADTILKPLGITKPTGTVGQATRNFLNVKFNN
jgi:hypothetical protein